MSILAIVSLALSVASLILHAIAPKTKTKVDDTVAEVVDVAKTIVPASGGPVLRSVPTPGDEATRDHRGEPTKPGP